MANRTALVHTSIWKDPDFLARSVAAQRLYVLLFSQEDVNLCGVLPLRISRWADLAADSTVNSVRRAYRELEDHRYVVTDQRAEETLIRTFVRHAGTLKQPKVIAGMSRHYGEVRSAPLRAAIIGELPGDTLACVRGDLQELIRDPFLTDFAKVHGNPWGNPSPKGTGKPSTKGNGEPFDKPLDEAFPPGYRDRLTAGPQDRLTALPDEVDLVLQPTGVGSRAGSGSGATPPRSNPGDPQPIDFGAAMRRLGGRPA